MFHKYKVFYDGRLIGTVNALTENDAKYKGEFLAEQATGIRRSASAYTGLATRLVTVEKS